MVLQWLKGGPNGSWHIPRIIALLLVVGILTATVGAGVTWARIYQAEPPLADFPRGEAVPGKTHILVAGIDNYRAMTGRSDTMMVLSVDHKTGQMVFLSIPRDSRYDIPGHGIDKLNQSMLLGGIPLLRACVEELLGIRVDHYIFTNLAGFEKIVDAVGGLTIEVTTPMRIRTTWPAEWVELEPGTHRMDGLLAMAYLRFRTNHEGDFGRMRRQRQFLVTLTKEALRIKNVYRLPLLALAMAEAVRTDIPLHKGLSLALSFRRLDMDELETVHLPGTPKILDGKAFVLLDDAAKDRLVDQYLWGRPAIEGQ